MKRIFEIIIYVVILIPLMIVIKFLDSMDKD